MMYLGAFILGAVLCTLCVTLTAFVGNLWNMERGETR